MTRALLLLALLLLSLLAACVEVELPSSEQIEQLFVAEGHEMRLHEPDPAGVPTLDAEELGGWRMLCDQCHLGPYYSSHSILDWGHKTECESQSTCLNCHGSTLHRMDVRGSKSVCFECHLERALTTACDDCHVDGWRQQHTPAGHSKSTHGNWAVEDATHCASCHGTEKWCIDCHGVPMPHPESFLREHPAMVRGEPQLCAQCHGPASCQSCHDARGVTMGGP